MQRWMTIALLALATLGWPTAGRAQASDDEVALRSQLFMPDGNGLGYFSVESARTGELGKLIASLHANYATGVLGTWNGDQLQTWAVRRQLGVDLQLGIGLRVVELVVLAPMAPYQEGSGLAGAEFGMHPFGDLVVRPKGRILDPDVRGFGLAVAMPISLPTGKASALYGEAGVTVSPTVIGELRRGPLDVGVNLGVVAREPTAVGGMTIGTQFRWGLAVRLRPARVFGLQAELWGLAGGTNPAANPVNWLGGIHLASDQGFVLRAGVGSGLGPGYGAPKVRVVFGIGVCPPAGPAVSEERRQQRAARRAARQAGRGDDAEDAVAMDGPGGAEAAATGTAGDGASAGDANDNDARDDAGAVVAVDPDDPDAIEVIPIGPPTLDADAPPDHDADGVADDDDFCPLYAEDVDGFQDDDGCPDDDNDGDGLADAVDLCPLESEVFNDFADGDGCPDEVSLTVETPLVEVDPLSASLVTAEPVRFDEGSAALRHDAFRVLNSIATLLMRHEIQGHIEIVGHVDGVGAGERTPLDRQRAEVVRTYLVNLGVDGDHLVAVGGGESAPSDASADPSGPGRRVEFHIAE